MQLARLWKNIVTLTDAVERILNTHKINLRRGQGRVLENPKKVKIARNLNQGVDLDNL